MARVEGVDSAWYVLSFLFLCSVGDAADLGTAIATKRHGWVTVEDKLEALMEGTASSAPENVDWGPEWA